MVQERINVNNNFMKVICVDARNAKNDEFGGPNPKEGDTLTVSREGIIHGIYSYQFVEYGVKYAYSAWRFAQIDSGIDETEVVNEREEVYG
jgi:hypothetical protein